MVFCHDFSVVQLEVRDGDYPRSFVIVKNSPLYPMAQAFRSSLDKWDLMKLGTFYKAKDTDNRTNQQLTD